MLKSREMQSRINLLCIILCIIDQRIRLQLVTLSAVVTQICADTSSEGKKMKEPMSLNPVALTPVVQRVHVRMCLYVMQRDESKNYSN